MRIEKIIKYYSLFLLSAIIAGSIGYFDTGKNYMASVFNFSDDLISNDKDDILLSENSIEKYNPDLFSFDINVKSKNAFAFAGEKEKEIARIYFGAKNSYAVLKYLKFKINGVDPLLITKALIKDGHYTIAEAKNENGFLIFENIDSVSKGNENKILSLQIDLAKNIVNGSRIRLDLEKPEDAIVKISGVFFSAFKNFPFIGKSLSIVGHK